MISPEVAARLEELYQQEITRWNEQRRIWSKGLIPEAPELGTRSPIIEIPVIPWGAEQEAMLEEFKATLREAAPGAGLDEILVFRPGVEDKVSELMEMLNRSRLSMFRLRGE